MTEIKVQVVSRDTGEVAYGPKRLPNFSERAKELGDSLNEVAAALRGRLHELGTKGEDGWDLEQVSLSFSLDLQAEAGVIVARASTKAGFQAALTWKRSGLPGKPE
jgi:Trypsin-co-occurring domain 1